MPKPPAPQRRFLFLQGPHGPFFYQLGKLLQKTGATCWRVGFNQGDGVFWPQGSTYIRFNAPQETWPKAFKNIVADKGITDIVLYGDTRPIHAKAIEIARQSGLTVHIFEEGYLRPYWVTYERDGSNGYSALIDTPLSNIQCKIGKTKADHAEAPAHWGDLKQHVFYGALYHWFVMFTNWRYRNFKRHRALPVSQEFWLYFKRLILMPFHWLDRILATRRIKSSGAPFHLALLQLEHDSSFQAHSPLPTMASFIELVVKGFAEGAAPHHILVFKAHPLENGQLPLRRHIRQCARKNGVAGRVHFVKGGKLATLMDGAKTVTTINSTAAQQALWRGLPLKIFGEAVYNKPEFVSAQDLPDFFADPVYPDHSSYLDYRHFLLETSQVAGGFYSRRGRSQLLRQVVEKMLAESDPYSAL
ncbi:MULTISPECIES: capsule biosynthesis protein [Halocynthiibacter]|uniref:Capsular biosynthesis protein n=1 Tax=Halocynthiibacter halioticoli TaxID=2986804 RepID=A0AAE3IZ10_9RHOB|nr:MULTISPECIES: capsular biosynthesis protein [Halocynthiibacter]MCV6824932.1 capsular biosynthesis protein [Halocynthiibacter halioticoli]MCW4057933.1 capsular biosynthesis protein [Halocynthiibacter sp. SDUM655004]